MGTMGVAMGDYVLEEFQKADLVIAIGYDIVEYGPAFWNPDQDKVIVRIHSVPEDFVDFFDLDIPVTVTNVTKKRKRYLLLATASLY
jgi:acetolactate synthase-1/2/3 large subunit